ncbi:DUF6710 family protein [Ruminococcus sp.]|uniref:DUF6710 family protein n=1 Tax=Ruminococcus sp. TaxID=41978 RepID=UPI0025CE5632|nr:DUF6710 family protein [Ruminococcus sp.]
MFQHIFKKQKINSSVDTDAESLRKAEQVAQFREHYHKIINTVTSLLEKTPDTDNENDKELMLEYIINSLLDYACSEAIVKPLYNDHENLPRPFPIRFYDEDSERLDFDIQKRTTVDLASTKIYVWPWNNSRTQNSIIRISKEKFVFFENNHRAIYYPDINLCYVHNGNHSINAGRYFKKGSIAADEYDLTKGFKHISTDGAYWYNSHTGEELEPTQDFRFAAVFTIAKMKYDITHPNNK